jgi:hypothetical protein
MTLKSAAFLALIGMLLLTILAAVDFINIVIGVANGIIAAVALLRSLVYLFANLSVTLFFYAFYRGQSR